MSDNNTEFKRGPSLSFWKARKDGNGSSAHLDFNLDKKSIFLSFMPQKGTDERNFDKDKKITSKLNLQDVGEMLAVCRRHIDGVGRKEGDKYKGLFHSSPNENDNSIIGFEKWKDIGYYLSLSVKRNGNSQRESVLLSYGEVEQLHLFLVKCGMEMF